MASSTIRPFEGSVLVGRLESEPVTRYWRLLRARPFERAAPGGPEQSDQDEDGQECETAGGDQAGSFQDRRGRQFFRGPAGKARRYPAQPAADERDLLEVQSFRMVEPPAAQVILGNARGVCCQE